MRSEGPAADMRRICLADPLWPLSRIPAQVPGGPRVPKRALPESRAGLRPPADRHDVKLRRLGPVCLGPVQIHIVPVRAAGIRTSLRCLKLR